MELLKLGEASVREFQRALGVSSPGTAKYYLEKLVELGLAEKVGDKYRAKVAKDLPIIVYMSFLGKIVPRILFYAVFATTMLVTYIALTNTPIIYVVPAIPPTALLWLETLLQIKCIRNLRKMKD